MSVVTLMGANELNFSIYTLNIRALQLRRRWLENMLNFAAFARINFYSIGEQDLCVYCPAI